MKVQRWWLSNDYGSMIAKQWGGTNERWVTIIATSN